MVGERDTRCAATGGVATARMMSAGSTTRRLPGIMLAARFPARLLPAMALVPLPRGGALPGRARAGRGRTRGRGPTTLLAAFLRRLLARLLAASGAALLPAAARDGVLGGPGPALGFLLRHAALLVALLDMLLLPLLLGRVLALVTAGHDVPPVWGCRL